MSLPAAIHKSFTIERTYPHSAEKVFLGFSDETKKRRWFTESEGFVIDSYSLDFSINGFERTRFRFGAGPPMTNDTVFLDIVPDRRITFAYSMTIGGQPLSCSLATIELEPRGSKTLLRFTEHTTFLDGNDGSAGRKEGTEGLLSRLADALAR